MRDKYNVAKEIFDFVLDYNRKNEDFWLQFNFLEDSHIAIYIHTHLNCGAGKHAKEYIKMYCLYEVNITQIEKDLKEAKKRLIVEQSSEIIKKIKESRKIEEQKKELLRHISQEELNELLNGEKND